MFKRMWSDVNGCVMPQILFDCSISLSCIHKVLIRVASPGSWSGELGGAAFVVLGRAKLAAGLKGREVASSGDAARVN